MSGEIGKPEMAIRAPKTSILPFLVVNDFRLSTLLQSPRDSFFELRMIETLRFAFGISILYICYDSKDINISGCSGHIGIFGLSQSLGDTLSSSQWSKMPDLSSEFRRYLS